MKGLSQVRAILVKDFWDSFKNRTVFFAIIFPVLLSLVFRAVLSPRNIPPLRLAVVNDSSSQLANFFRLYSLGRIVVESLPGEEEAKKKVREGQVQGALILPDDFEDKVKSGRTPRLDFWVNQDQMGRAAVLEMAVNRFLYYYQGQSPPAEVVLRSVLGKEYSPGTALLPTWILFTVLGAYMVVVSSIMEEKDKKTLQAILVTPCGLPQVLVGKGLLGFLLSVAGVLMILGFNGGFIGNILSTLLIIIAGTAFFTFLGTMMGLILPSQTTANVVGSIIFMGMFMPVVMAPTSKAMNTVARFLPSYYLSDGINQSMFTGAGPDRLWIHLMILGVTSIIMLLLSMMYLNRKEII